MNDNEADRSRPPGGPPPPFRALVRLIPSPAELIVMQAQGVLARYIEPLSGISEHECINSLLELLDAPEAVAIAQRFGRRS